MREKETVLVYVVDERQGAVLLAEKVRGLGAGKINGAGGHIDPGETPAQAAVRELREEFCLTAREQDLAPVAEQVFHLSDVTIRNRTFLLCRWEGEPAAAPGEDIGEPAWYPIASLPYERMWSTDHAWLPLVLGGNFVRAEFWFASDDLTHRRHIIHECRPYEKHR